MFLNLKYVNAYVKNALVVVINVKFTMFRNSKCLKIYQFIHNIKFNTVARIVNKRDYQLENNGFIIVMKNKLLNK